MLLRKSRDIIQSKKTTCTLYADLPVRYAHFFTAKLSRSAATLDA